MRYVVRHVILGSPTYLMFNKRHVIKCSLIVNGVHLFAIVYALCIFIYINIRVCVYVYITHIYNYIYAYYIHIIYNMHLYKIYSYVHIILNIILVTRIIISILWTHVIDSLIININDREDLSTPGYSRVLSFSLCCNSRHALDEIKGLISKTFKTSS